MNGDLHQISQAIGRLEAGEAERASQVRELFRKMDDIKDTLAAIGPTLATVHAMKPEVEDWTRTKNRAMGAIAFLSCIAAVMGAVGDWAATHLAKFLR